MAKAVFDLDAAAAKREAAGEPFVFTFKGDTFKCLPAQDWPIQVPALMTSNMTEALRLILGGGAKADLFMSHNPTMGDVEALLEGLAEFSGLGDAGE